ncbi:unnamed protein product [Auanema sp. JU1783]|nr:unnamed protein product [Auanema sp. JU1783]
MKLEECWFRVTLNCLSILGIIVMTISFYLMLFVPAKLNFISKLAIHGHEISSGISQIFFTIIAVPTITLPCIGIYVEGAFSHFSIMSPLSIAWAVLILLIIEGWFVGFISVIRVFAVSMNVNETTKKRILFYHFTHLLIQVSIFVYGGVSLSNAGEVGLNECEKLDKNIVELYRSYSESSIYFIPAANTTLYFLICDGLFLAIVYTVVSSICGSILLKHLRSQATATQSFKHSTRQRNFTTAVLCLLVIEVFGLGAPCAYMGICCMFKLGSPIHSRICIMIIAIYPLLGCSCIWLANPVYRNRIGKIARKVSFNFWSKTSTQKVSAAALSRQQTSRI